MVTGASLPFPRKKERRRTMTKQKLHMKPQTHERRKLQERNRLGTVSRKTTREGLTFISLCVNSADDNSIIFFLFPKKIG